ncbi:uncharacterized protein LOC135696565 isoform X2 [Rhopilema esculentum]|uniref:uncharacterized protein LOC135696565 isoform X2 n=1 Tax=Rhopilema esculentum TaxID=499914 RepID=UPI0031DD148D
MMEKSRSKVPAKGKLTAATKKTETPDAHKKKGESVASLLSDIDALTNEMMLKKRKNYGKKYATKIFRVGSTDAKTGSRHVHSSKHVPYKRREQAATMDGNYSDSDDCDLQPTTSFEVTNEHVSVDKELLEILESCDDLIRESEAKLVRQPKQTWFERRDAALTKWESSRESILETSICEKAFSKKSCSYCKKRAALINCNQCRKHKYLCFLCDDIVHSLAPLHDRAVFIENQMQKITPLQGLTEKGIIVEINRCPIMTLPSKCAKCGMHGQWRKLPSNQKCILVNCRGRFDLNKFQIECLNCSFCSDLFDDVCQLIRSRYWPGSVGTVSYLFDEDMFESWESFMLRMPGSSEHGFIGSLEDISQYNNRVGHIQRDAFSQAFKEFKFLKAMRNSFYGSAFVCNKHDVGTVIDKIYNKSNNSTQEAESALCGSTQWLAARNVCQEGRSRDETGIELMSCRHCIALKAVNMYRGEIFGYAYYLQKNYAPKTRFYFSDVACRYSKWLRKVDYDLYCSQTPAIGMMHVKGHPAFCEVLYGGLWTEGSGYTIGEEDEQIFSYLSRTGSTIKHMLPEHRDDAITEFAMYWNKRKVDKMAELLHRRFKQVCQKERKAIDDINLKSSEVDQSRAPLWKNEAVALAQVSQNALVDVNISQIEELILLAIQLNCQNKLTPPQGRVVPLSMIERLRVNNLKLRILAKPLNKLLNKYEMLDAKFFSESHQVSENEIRDCVCRLIPVYQQKLQGLVYSNLHISQNINRLADSSKKRRKLRLKVANQKSLLKDLVNEYNSQILAMDLAGDHPVCKMEDVEKQKFPWHKESSKDATVDPEVKQELLTIHLLVERIKEEKVLLRSEMHNYLTYYKDLVIPPLKEKAAHLQELLSQLCSCDASSMDAGISTGCDCGIKRGELSLILQGISYAIEQIKRGQIWFKDILASSEKVPSFIQEFPNVDELFDPDSSSDSELSVDFNFDDEH